MRKPKAPPVDPTELSTAIVIRTSNRLREKLRTAAFKARLPISAYARQLLEQAVKQKRATP
jgi:predicted HicB family RNase H-like nuclease